METNKEIELTEIEKSYIALVEKRVEDTNFPELIDSDVVTQNVKNLLMAKIVH